MGYTTTFTGRFDLDRPLTKQHAHYLEAFSNTRRMKRNPQVAATMPDPVRVETGLPIGEEAGYFVGRPGFHGPNDDPSVVDYNEPPIGQPGLWCGWAPSADRNALVWDCTEKFYNYVEWLCYLIDHFLKPWGYIVNGEVMWRGEDYTDVGVIRVVNNQVQALKTNDSCNGWRDED